MKKNSSMIVVIIVVIVIIVGGYMVLYRHKSTTTTSSTTAAVNNAVLMTKNDSKLGQYLTDSSGKTLYTYGSDTSGVSNCNGGCLATWPAYVDKGSTTNLPSGVSTITRTDNGETQYNYNVMPLYYFASDGNGQATGDGVGGFHVAKPAASSTTSGSNSSSGYPY